jgi:hypothetical protein
MNGRKHALIKLITGLAHPNGGKGKLLCKENTRKWAFESFFWGALRLV